MYIAIAGILLSVVLMLFNVQVSTAELWACSQANGSTLYTNEPQAESSCEKFEPAGRVIYLPPRIWAGPPLSDVASEKQEVTEADAPPASTGVEPTTFATDAGESYKAKQDSFWSWDESRIVAYTYVFSFNGTSRHMRHRDFLRHPRKQHGVRHNIPLWDQSARLTAPKHGRANSVRGGTQTAKPQSLSPASSKHIRGGSVGAAAAVAPARPSGVRPQMRR